MIFPKVAIPAAENCKTGSAQCEVDWPTSSHMHLQLKRQDSPWTDAEY